MDDLRAGASGSMSELARSCGLTRAHFTRRFRALTGNAPYAVMLGSRVEHAKHLLTTGHRSISEVAYATGFTDQSHLSHTFQRLVGTTPARFRALHRRTTQELTSTNLQDRA
jgi:AraC family transcriptional regulator